MYVQRDNFQIFAELLLKNVDGALCRDSQKLQLQLFVVDERSISILMEENIIPPNIGSI